MPKQTDRQLKAYHMGLLAGSTVMLLTVIWGSCILSILIGKCDLQDNLAKDNQDTRGFSLTVMKVRALARTYGKPMPALLLAISVIPFIIVQFLQMLHYDSGRNMAVLIGLIVSVSFLISYCLYQVFQPWVQKRRLDYIKHRHVMSGILKHLKKRALGRLSTEEGRPNVEVLSKLFKANDENSDGYLSHNDLRALIIGIQFNDVSLDYIDAVEKVMNEFDTSQDSRIDLPEFIAGVGKWLDEAKTGSESNRGADSMKYIDDFHMQTKREHFLLGVQSEEGKEGVENSPWTTVKAVLLLLLRSAIAAAFSDPLVDSVQNISDATRIPTFFISCCVCL